MAPLRYYRDSHGAIICFDPSNEKVKHSDIVDLIKKLPPNVECIVAITKCDLLMEENTKKKIRLEENISKFEKTIEKNFLKGMKIIKVSSKKSINVKLLYSELAKMILKKYNFIDKIVPNQNWIPLDQNSLLIWKDLLKSTLCCLLILRKVKGNVVNEIPKPLIFKIVIELSDLYRNEDEEKHKMEEDEEQMNQNIYYSSIIHNMNNFL